MSRHELLGRRVTYTELCMVALVASLVLDLFVLRTRLVTRRAFWVSYAIIIGFQLLTNGWLTGRRIVTYDADAVIGGAEPVLLGSGRLFYAPVEDLAFGFALVLQTLAWWVFWGRRGVQREIRQSASEPPRVGQQAP
jgi:lycopene cyclase domain-containing protein